MTSGRIDTNVFVHALKDDPQSEECRSFIRLLQNGHVRARLEPYVVHELSYILPRRLQDWNRRQLGAYLLNLIEWPGIECDRPLLQSVIVRWSTGPQISFVDAILWAEALRDGTPVYTKNNKDFVGGDVEVPNPLPGTEQQSPNPTSTGT
jgi:predicted nucleic acid-binding protein